MKLNKKRLLLLLAAAVLLLLLLSLNPGGGHSPAAGSPSPALTLVSSTPTTSAPPAPDSPQEPAPAPSEEPPAPAAALQEDGVYTSAEDVALYLHTYGHLPSNFITKTKARAAGWEGGSLEPYCPGMCIGGGGFANREGSLPDAPGRSWKECDINTLGKSSRGPERLVYSNDGLIYYTGDHYESFQLLYGEP